MKYYIAYGSNLNVKQMIQRCPDSIPIGTAILHDMKLAFCGNDTCYSYLTIMPCNGYFVQCGIWSVSDNDETALDIYEGYPELYHKEEIRITVHRFDSGEDEDITAFIYIMNDSDIRSLEEHIPDDYYYGVCRVGYHDFGLNYKYLDDAYYRAVIADSIPDKFFA